MASGFAHIIGAWTRATEGSAIDNLWLEGVALFGGLVYLLIGGDFLVRGAIGLSRRADIPPLIVGLTVVAFGTSAPELVVSVYAALEGFTGLAVGNVVGSNIANVLLVLGVPALIHTAKTGAGVSKHARFMVLVSIGFIAMCFTGTLTVWHGAVMIGVLIGSTVLAVRGRHKVTDLDLEEAQTELERGLGKPTRLRDITILIGLGTIALAIGADLTVEAGVAIALALGVSDAVIGSSLVAVGTSLPELGTTMLAALHRSYGVALGNVIGSNVLNILGVMGVTVLIVDVPVPLTFLAFDLWVMLAASVVLWIYLALAPGIGRRTGIAFLLGYAGYLGVIFQA